MLIEVIGGSGSGKSEFAEQRCMELCRGRKLYIATMQPFDEESRKRIERHRKMRAGKQFDTVEVYTGLENIEIPRQSTVLLECMSNLIANEMFSPAGRTKDTDQIIDMGVDHLCRYAANVVIVTNQVFSDGINYDETTMEYLRVLGAVNRSIAKKADEVWEVVCGIPIELKQEAEK